MTAQDAHDRFAAATDRHLRGTLIEGVELRAAASPEAWRAISEPMWPVSDDHPRVTGPLPATDEQRAQGADLDAIIGPLLEHRLLLHAGDEVIGAYWGQQEQHGRYYMVSSVIRHDWRGRGVYKALLPRIVAAVADAGFAEIYSRHRANNNPILVPKLRAGFIIAGFDVSPRHGLLVQLRRYLREPLDALFQHRFAGLDATRLRALGIDIR